MGQRGGGVGCLQELSGGGLTVMRHRKRKSLSVNLQSRLLDTREFAECFGISFLESYQKIVMRNRK